MPKFQTIAEIVGYLTMISIISVAKLIRLRVNKEDLFVTQIGLVLTFIFVFGLVVFGNSDLTIAITSSLVACAAIAYHDLTTQTASN